MATTVIRLRPDQLGVAITATAKQAPAVALHAIAVSSQRAVAHLKKTTPVDTGRAKNAWQAKQGPRGASVLNDAPYIGILERGARPHDVSAEGWMAILRWVLRHPQLIGSARAVAKARSAMNAGRRSKATSTVSWVMQVATEITNAIVWKLKHEGQTGHWMVRDGMPLFKKWLAEDINRMFANFIRNGGRF